MKIYFALLIAFFISITSVECKAQWPLVYQDNAAQFYDAAFPTDYTGYVAAADTGGTVILRTNDGGATWNKRYIPALGFINRIVMIDSLKGYLIRGGVPGKLLRTTDGFTTFTGANLDTSFSVQSLCLLNDSTGFYLNNAARLRRFENYGASIFHIIDTLIDGQNLQFMSPTFGFMDTGTGLLKTTDAGATWIFANTNLGFFCSTFNFADTLKGYFSDATAISTTHDGGLTFPLNYNFANAYNITSNGNFCIAANDTGAVAYTLNSGATWQIQSTGINLVVAEPYKVVMTPSNRCFIFSQFCGEIRKQGETFTSGINETDQNNMVSIYPNPFSSEATIYFEKHQKNTTIKIIDLLGKEIQTQTFTGKVLKIDRGMMQAGMYCIQITDEHKKVINKKIILQ
ncbi:MAG: T9SS type A sorting domain-containing protein [Bacteroidetes bacterium]|nr:T9SS type A sorting domain-containing protein [Bacteroidota bacterium]